MSKQVVKNEVVGNGRFVKKIEVETATSVKYVSLDNGHNLIERLANGNDAPIVIKVQDITSVSLVTTETVRLEIPKDE